ncbi:hypothetical protein [Vibrio sp. 10N.261.51.F12]|uniref:hypothetical protein n=1 Tax=Vibrio sp. 10N.261.51.F12 TaxID=3229679 RepID=UPI003550F1FD
MNEVLANTLLWGGIITITAGLQGIFLDKYLQLSYKMSVTESLGRLFSRTWGFNTAILGALMITASQNTALTTVITLAAILSKTLLIGTILFTGNGRLRAPMKSIIAVDSIMTLLLIYGLAIN